MNSRTQRTVSKHAVTLAAVLVLLGQAVFPHEHGWHGRSSSTAHDAALAFCTAECPTAFSSATQDADGDKHHHSSTCPLCRAQSDARSLTLPASFSVPILAAILSTLATDTVAKVSEPLRKAAAPRAPPLAS